MDVLNSYMKALEWAIDFNRKTISKIEYAFRNSYIDSVCEQALGGKAIINDLGIRDWDTKHQVPLRLTSVHTMATFLTPLNREFHFSDLINALARKVGDPTIKRPQKNRYRLIMQEMKKQAEDW